MSEADHLSLRTENDIWRTAEKMVYVNVHIVEKNTVY